MFNVRQDQTIYDHPGFRRMFAKHRLTLGIFFPIESFKTDQPRMQNQMSLAQQAEQANFAALWFRDVPLRDPSFGDVGQIFDPWVYLGYVVAHTHHIALATGAIILPLRHPVHTAKAAASVDQLSGGRLVLGVASGDRPVEYPAFAYEHAQRGERFREHLRYFDALLGQEFPHITTGYGSLEGDADLVPKPWLSKIPRLITGSSQQDIHWIVEHSDGWLTYPRSLARQQALASDWHQLVKDDVGGTFKPFAQSLYIDLVSDPDRQAVPIHLGVSLGRNALIDMFRQLQEAGVNHIALNLKYGSRPAELVLAELAEYVLPHFPALT